MTMAVFSWFGDACSCTRKKCDPSCMTYAHYLEERKPITNADRIRSMTDEELAHLLHTAEEHIFNGNLWNYEQWQTWLKSPVEVSE